jgi:hypothetical protein
MVKRLTNHRDRRLTNTTRLVELGLVRRQRVRLEKPSGN